MSKYLKKFENHTQYENYINGSEAILPNVSICTTEGDVHYNPSTPPTPPTPSHDYVDLGLPSGTKWATMNVGASSITDFGNYYKYGLGASQYDNVKPYYDGAEKPLAASADTAVQVWGGQWHMPTKTQFEELTANTTYEWATIDGINGGKFTAQNGNYVFFPAAGYWKYGSQDSVGSDGGYWSSTPNFSEYAYNLVFYNDGNVVTNNWRGYGFPIRPVMDA